jgi:rhamnose transport system substrate-binding protein
VGVQAAAQELQQEGKCGAIKLTGLGLPNDMRKYVKAGCAGAFALWNEQDLGDLATYTAHLVLTGQLTGKIGQSFKAGKLGKRTVVVNDGNRRTSTSTTLGTTPGRGRSPRHATSA